MKKSLIAATVGVLAGATLLMSAAPAMAHDRIGFGVSIGLPVAPVAYVAPAPVVYGGYGPVVQVGSPYYYGRDWRFYHGYRGDRGYHYEGHRGGDRGWHR